MFCLFLVKSNVTLLFQIWQCLPRDHTKHFHYDSRITSTKWSRGHDILSHSHKLICCGHDKTSLSEPNISPPGCSKCFVRLFGDHLLFPVDDLWATFCTIWISALWILNIEFDVPNVFFILKTRSCIFEKLDICSQRIQNKKSAVWKCMSIKKTAIKKINCVKFQMFNIQVKKKN